MHQLLWISEIEIKSDGKYDNTGWSMNIGIENDSHFATHLYQTSSKSSMKSRLQILETLKIPCFLKTTELNIDAFRVPQTWCGPPTFNNGFSKRNRPIGVEIEMLTKLTAVIPAPAKSWVRVLKTTNEHVSNVFLCTI